MNDNITLNGPGLADFLDRIGLPQAARARVVEIDRELASRLESDDPGRRLQSSPLRLDGLGR